MPESQERQELLQEVAELRNKSVIASLDKLREQNIALYRAVLHLIKAANTR